MNLFISIHFISYPNASSLDTSNFASKTPNFELDTPSFLAEARDHGYVIDGYIIVKVWCNFFAGVLCSTLYIGQFVVGFRKVNICQSSIEKHCKSLKLDKI